MSSINITDPMKKVLLIAGVVLYVFFMLICLAANAGPAKMPKVHVHVVREINGKTIVRDSVFTPDISMMKKKMKERRKMMAADSSDAHMRRRRGMHRGGMAGFDWHGPHKRGFFKNADSISVNIHIRRSGDSLTREMTRIAYFNNTKDGRKADTMFSKTVTVHKGMNPGDEGVNDGFGQDRFSAGVNPNRLRIPDLNVYPNPTSGNLNITFSLQSNDPVTIKITDEQGKTLWQEQNSNFSGAYNHTVDLSKVQKGMYFLEISQSDRIMRKKLVIN